MASYDFCEDGGASWLVGIDASESAHKAFSYAMRHTATGEQVLLTHAYLDGSPTAKARAQQLAESFVQQCTSKKRQCSVALVPTDSLQPARVGEILVKKAAELAPSALILGSHGHGGYKLGRLGSVATFCVNNANTSVVVVRESQSVQRPAQLA
mmetsp:Transcript_1216/g.1342  ORF Transcript_1216/g.1342 Transcript_1216/m.1342 type:complete len:154 (+) Transcript_1216:100-561(+)|eukprot:CAMPEP_0205827302 /NCGR_PEP_ID=MMETSP0206-20130828/31528_1 /ASSEMBLY_ACC=CAM_ASM_000279 /TAXON_ID=36767 /ORGANISM="Euplotes focardii, Strain TN1" /LENGTH=153 /DNA_ID=CAMNT_0053128079 /DNA_START=97 /DNA_END=558 /DNA_ORIENTATION=+